jgi:preprotein translocase subunit SecE
MAEENAIAAKPKQWVAWTRESWRDMTAEMKKVTWPSRQEVVGTTVVVLVSTLVFAIYLWGCDQAFFWLTTSLFKYFGAST